MNNQPTVATDPSGLANQELVWLTPYTPPTDIPKSQFFKTPLIAQPGTKFIWATPYQADPKLKFSTATQNAYGWQLVDEAWKVPTGVKKKVLTPADVMLSKLADNNTLSFVIPIVTKAGNGTIFAQVKEEDGDGRLFLMGPFYLNEKVHAKFLASKFKEGVVADLKKYNQKPLFDNKWFGKLKDKKLTGSKLLSAVSKSAANTVLSQFGVDLTKLKTAKLVPKLAKGNLDIGIAAFTFSKGTLKNLVVKATNTVKANKKHLDTVKFAGAYDVKQKLLKLTAEFGYTNGITFGMGIEQLSPGTGFTNFAANFWAKITW